MGIDLLDLTFRIEKEFAIDIPRDELQAFLLCGNTDEPPQGAWTDHRVSEYVAFIESLISDQQIEPATDVYERVKKTLIEMLLLDDDEVLPDSWMVRDLGME